MRALLFSLMLAGSLSLPFEAASTTIIPFQYLSQLYLASDAVAVVRAKAPYETNINNCTHNDCDFQVITKLKGPLVPSQQIMLRQVSYYDSIGHLYITGDFIPKQNHTYLIFLNKNGNAWRPMMMSYYIFELTVLAEVFYWVPVKESLNIGTFPRPDGAESESLAVYKKDALLDLLMQYNEHPELPWDASSARTDIPASTALAMDRALPTGCDFDMGGGLSRWLNQTIRYYYDVTSAPADAAARFGGALNMLNTEYTGLNLINSGTANFTPDCSDNSVVGQDFINFANSSLNGNQSVLIFYEDPCNQITNLTGCSGVLGIGGGYMLSTTHTYKGDTWKNAAWGYLVVNNGVSACLTPTNYERFLTHEMTHTLKMDHLDATAYPNNNMNPSCCNAINTKDRQCMNYTYESPLPVELISFDAAATDQGILLRWKTAQETDNDYFILEKSGDGLRYGPLTTIATSSDLAQPATYQYVDEQPTVGISYYRLSQQDLDGQVNVLATRAVTLGITPRYVLAPNPVNGNLLLLTGISEDYPIESLEILEMGGAIRTQAWSTTSASNTLELPISNLPAGIYWLKIRTGAHSDVIKFVRM